MNRQQLIEDNINLVYFVVNKYYPTFQTDEDVIQSGMLGLCKAADSWDEDKSLFSTYASKCIRSEICMEFRRRKKHGGLLSLDYEVKDGEGDNVSFSSVIKGEVDINFVDVDPIVNRLTAVEKDVFNLLLSGMSPSDISESYGWSNQKTNQIVRKIRLLWRNLYGN